MPLVSVIVVTWNAGHLLRQCLDSLCRQTFKDFEAIVVDNASQDDTVAMLKSDFPGVRVIELSKNTGFTGGNIEGLKHAGGKFICLLNNDTEVSREWLEALVKPMLDNDNIGISTSRVIAAGTNILDSAGGGLTTAFSGFKIGMGKSADLYSEIRYVPGGYACACLYRKRMLDEIGFFDEDFVFNHEDTDLDFRALLAGWKCVYAPEAVVRHRVSATLGRMSARTVYYLSRNSEFVWVKNAPLRLMLRYMHHRVLYEAASFWHFGIQHRQWKAFLKGKWDALKVLPIMLQKRKQIKSLRKISAGTLRESLTPLTEYLKERMS